jgi:hypothetical protein
VPATANTKHPPSAYAVWDTHPSLLSQSNCLVHSFGLGSKRPLLTPGVTRRILHIPPHLTRRDTNPTPNVTSVITTHAHPK